MGITRSLLNDATILLDKILFLSLFSKVVEEKPAAEVEEEEEDQKNAGNLLDNLFRKTKTTPCLYWLPLSDEQVRLVYIKYKMCPFDQDEVVVVSSILLLKAGSFLTESWLHTFIRAL